MAKMSFTVTQWQLVDPTRLVYRALISAEIKDNNQPLDGRVIISAPEGEQTDINISAGRGIGTGEIFFTTQAEAVVLMAEANIQGQVLTARQPIALKTKSAKLIPDRVSANTSGGNGKYIFVVGVMDKDNAPVPDVPIRIINESTGADAATGQTDQHGSFSSPEITFRESECSFLVVTGGLDPIQLKLDGPSKWAKVQLPPADPDDTQYGLWHAIATGWHRGRNAVKATRRNP